MACMATVILCLRPARNLFLKQHIYSSIKTVKLPWPVSPSDLRCFLSVASINMAFLTTPKYLQSFKLSKTPGEGRDSVCTYLKLMRRLISCHSLDELNAELDLARRWP